MDENIECDIEYTDDKITITNIKGISIGKGIKITPKTIIIHKDGKVEIPDVPPAKKEINISGE